MALFLNLFLFVKLYSNKNMKSLFIFIAFFLSISVCSAQKFILKGHVFGTNSSRIDFTSALGCEGFFSKRVSLQILTAYRKHTDIDYVIVRSSISVFPELRFYTIQEKRFTSFLGIFGESYTANPFAKETNFSINYTEKQHNIGVLLGSQWLIRKHWGLEMYAGLGRGWKVGNLFYTSAINIDYPEKVKNCRLGANLIYRV
jgi:hypothetical protein